MKLELFVSLMLVLSMCLLIYSSTLIDKYRMAWYCSTDKIVERLDSTTVSLCGDFLEENLPKDEEVWVIRTNEVIDYLNR